MFLAARVLGQSPELKIVWGNGLGAETTWRRAVPAGIRSERRRMLRCGDHSGKVTCLDPHGQLLRNRDGGESKCTASVQLMSVKVAIAEMTRALGNRHE